MMDNTLVLSLFPNIDLLGKAFEEAGFCVVRGPDLLWGGDIRTFRPPPGVFGGVTRPDVCACRCGRPVQPGHKYAVDATGSTAACCKRAQRRRDVARSRVTRRQVTHRGVTVTRGEKQNEKHLG